MKKIAQTTDGQFIRIGSNEDSALSLGFPNPQKFAHLNNKTISLWNNWWLYSLLTGLLLLDWIVRRKSGLS
jgi:hypothetical protein